MRPVVFLGPSLPLAAARAIADLDFRPPASRGDVYRAVERDGATIIGIVDGVFHQTLPVWHREVLWALEQGVIVSGAASMGALRAAELDGFGMVGIGKVVESYRTGLYAPFDGECFDGDDEVAVLQGPAELGRPSLTVALVDIREQMARAAQSGVVTRVQRDGVVATAKAMFYARRDWDGVLANAGAMGIIDMNATMRLRSWLVANPWSQKAADARELITWIASCRESAPPPGFRLERTYAWLRFVAEMESEAPPPRDDERAVLTGLSSNREANLLLRRWAKLAADVAAQARRLGVEPSEADQKDVFDALRHELGLMRREDLERWLGAPGPQRADAMRLIERLATLHAFLPDTGEPTETALIRALRTTPLFHARDRRNNAPDGGS